jgi:hypothetical protein
MSVEAMRSDASLARLLGLPVGEKVCVALGIGYPGDPNQVPAERKRVRPRLFQP